MTATLTAAEYVALAQRAAHEAPRDADSTEDADLVIIDRSKPAAGLPHTGEWYFEGTGRASPWPIAMRVTFTPENTSSENALVRALLASTLDVVPTPPRSSFHFVAQDARDGFTWGVGATKDEALRAALDALLSSSEVAR